MIRARSQALDQLVSDLEDFTIDLNQYYGDLEPQSVYDSILTGKLETLARFCSTLGWSELAGPLREMVPLKCSAVEVMEQVQGYILPEIRRLMSKADIDNASDPTDWFWQFVHPRIAALARKRF